MEKEKIKQLFMQKKLTFNRFPGGSDTLGNKDCFAKWVNLVSPFSPEAYNFMPGSYSYPSDILKLESDIKLNKGSYIAKPHLGSEGYSLYLFNKVKELQTHIGHKGSQDYVVQRYIDRPLLVRGLKFDLRVYVCLVSHGDDDMKAYLFEEGLARFCTEPYELPTKNNFRNEHMHFTNYTINKFSPNFVTEGPDLNVYEINSCSKRTITALLKELEQLGIDVAKVKENVKKACAGVFSVQAVLATHYTQIMVEGKQHEAKIF